MDLNTTSLTMKSLSEISDKWNRFNFSSILQTKEKINIIGSRKNSKHLCWNIDTITEELVHDFRADDMSEVSGPAVVYVSSKNMILLIGARSPKDAMDELALIAD